MCLLMDNLILMPPSGRDKSFEHMEEVMETEIVHR
jgi:hypothetical protein